CGSWSLPRWPTPRGIGSQQPWPSTPDRLLSMPWWTWILIWIALIALSLLFYLVLGIRLFRKFMVTVRELGAAGEKLGHLPEASPVPLDAGASEAKDDPDGDAAFPRHLAPGAA